MLSEVVSLKRRMSIGMMPSKLVLYVPVRPPSLHLIDIVSSPLPCRSSCCIGAPMSFHGLSSGTLNDCASDSIMRKVQPPPFSSACIHGSTAPPPVGFFGVGM